MTKIDALGVLGSVTGGSPGRSYVSIKKGNEVPVYNPTDATLTTILWSDRGSGIPEYGLYFQANCDVTYLLDHIDRVTDEIKALAPKEPRQSSATEYGSTPNVLLKAGTLLGYSDGTSMARTFDFLVKDQSKKAFHINESRWKWDQAIYGTCPYDYYTEDLKNKHYALLGTFTDSGLMKSESCGSPSQDVAGTASGGWFQGDSNTEKGKWLGIGQMFNWTEIVFRDNFSMGIKIKEYDSKITPDKITTDTPICYKGYEGTWAFLKLATATELYVATGQGNCPSIFPESSAEKWER